MQPENPRPSHDNVLYYGGRVTAEDLRNARPFTLDDELRALADGWVVFMPRGCKDAELRDLDDLLPD